MTRSTDGTTQMQEKEIVARLIQKNLTETTKAMKEERRINVGFLERRIISKSETIFYRSGSIRLYNIR